MPKLFPHLQLNDWKPTRDSLHQYTLVMGKIRRNYMPKLKHWWHITLDVSARGFTTGPFPLQGQIIELKLDLISHSMVIESNEGWQISHSLFNQSPAGICNCITESFAAAGITVEPELFEAFDSTDILVYEANAITRYHLANSRINSIIKTFQGNLREESSPVHLFPHHLDLCMNWFTGRLVPDTDPEDEETSDEQMTFGFVTGDDLVEDAYFFATAYPCPDKLVDLDLPKPAYWINNEWVGAILPYAAIAESNNGEELLIEFLHCIQKHGAKLMC